MPVFMVERYLPGTSPEELRRAVARTARTLRIMAPAGPTVRHLSCTFVPSEEAVFCVFEGPSRETVEAVNQRADFEFDQVIEVMEIVEAGRNGLRAPPRSAPGSIPEHPERPERSE